MSHIGKKPILVPAGVAVEIERTQVRVKGPKGEGVFAVSPVVEVRLQGSEIVCEQTRPGRQARALWGTTRARIANMVHGVSEGFVKKLELHGVGYRAAVRAGKLELSLGFSHPVIVDAPAGITFSVEGEEITVAGSDNQAVGQVAASLRSLKKPEPYKGKGVRYVGERVRRKVGKVVGTTA